MSFQKDPIYVKDYDVSKSKFPSCVCVYQNGIKHYCLAEINTGYYSGSIKIISEAFNDLSQTESIYASISSREPLLRGHIIYNDRSHL